MSDDEAFLRMIVANPGDDAPRLIYADWLEERDDPRGTYLRAECEWAKPWRLEVKAPEPEVLLPLATLLDPLWVYRVSRPPVGVCCDHITLTNPRPPVMPKFLDGMERRLKLKLPAEHRAFLLNCNGGVPDRTGYFTKGMPRDNYPNYCALFYSAPIVNRAVQRSRNDAEFAEERRDLEITTKALNNGFVKRSTDEAGYLDWTSGVRKFVSFAETGQGQLAIGLAGRRQGKVYYVNGLVLVGASQPRLVAPSLPAFLALLRFRTDIPFEDYMADRA